MVFLTHKSTIKSCQALDSLTPKRFELDLSNNVLNIYFDQGASKISKFKIGGRKKICQVSQLLRGIVESGRVDAFFSTSNFDL